jgi:hypothetical protein
MNLQSTIIRIIRIDNEERICYDVMMSIVGSMRRERSNQGDIGIACYKRMNLQDTHVFAIGWLLQKEAKDQLVNQRKRMMAALQYDEHLSHDHHRKQQSRVTQRRVIKVYINVHLPFVCEGMLDRSQQILNECTCVHVCGCVNFMNERVS